jgi:hypothetical protein
MVKLVYHLVTERTVVGLYDEVASLLNIFQTAAVLEVRFWIQCRVKPVLI